MKCNNYTTTPLSKFCYKCDPRLQNIKYIINSDEKGHSIIETKKHHNNINIDQIQEKLDPKKSTQKDLCNNKNFSKDVHNKNDETSKINMSFGILENTLIKIKKPKKTNDKMSHKICKKLRYCDDRFPLC